MSFSLFLFVFVLFDQIELVRRDYVANGGWETFLSYEDPEQDILVGLLRLRKCSEESFRPELKGGVSIVRELHVYGSVVPVSSRDPSKFQHQVLQAVFTFLSVPLSCTPLPNTTGEEFFLISEIHSLALNYSPLQ